MSHYTPEKVYTKLLYLKQYFTPFNWDIDIDLNVENKILKGISNNKYFNIHKDLYEKIVKLFPMKKDVNSLIYGFFLLNNDNIYAIKLHDINKYILYWNHLNKSYMNIIKEESSKIKDFLIINNFVINDILSVRKNKAPIIYQMYEQKLISGITLAAIYNLKKEDLYEVIKLSNEETPNLELNIFFRDLYKYTKILKLLLKIKKLQN